jgi:hypothetical protein
VFGKLVDRIAAVQQDAGIAVDEGNGRIAACGRGEAGIVGEGAGGGVERADVDDLRPDGPASLLEFVSFAAKFQFCSFFGHRKLLQLLSTDVSITGF